jgi:hypothetical protein
MPAGTSEKQGLFSRSVSLKWVLVMAAALVVIMAAIVVAVVLVDRSQDRADREAAQAATATTSGVASPYDLVELPVEAGLDSIEDAAFVSIYLPNEDGTLTSYGISADLPATQALSEAIRKADDVGDDEAAAALGAKAADSTITFVLPSRDTLTFALYLEQGMIARGSQVWRPDGDLKALVEAAVAKPQ